jgi:multiple sugar transport system permease protein/fructooligosaccharide transport system permease protein
VKPAFKNILAVGVSSAAGLFFLFPLLWMFTASFTPDRYVMRAIESFWQFIPASFNFENYAGVFARVGFLNNILVSLGFTFTIVMAGLFINSMCGYAFARLRFPGRNFLFSIIVALIIIPFEALVLPLFLILGVQWNLMNTLPGLFLPYLAKAFNIFFMRQYFLSFPKELEESARMEGASWFRIFFSLALPLAKPALATCAILDFITHWSEYFWPLIMTNQLKYETVQVGLGHFYTLPPIQWGDIMAYSVMATIPMILIFVFFQRYIVLSVARAGLKD